MIMIERWLELQPRPDWGVGLDDRNGEHSPLPHAIAERRSQSQSRTIVWAFDGRCGVLSDQASFDWSPNPTDRLELYIQRPAKGAGNLYLQLHRHQRPAAVVAFANRYSVTYHEWLTALGDALGHAAGLSFRERDEGFDA